MNNVLKFLAGGLVALALSQPTFAAIAGDKGSSDLVIAEGGKSSAIVVVSPAAGTWEKRAAADLVKYVGVMSGATPTLADTDAAIQAALSGNTPVLVIGQAALQAEPSLKDALSKIAKPDPMLQADAIVVRRAGNRVYIVGSNDESNYYATAELLERWGCRWFMPTEFGECIPVEPTLSVGDIDYAYAPPFEVRCFWLSWNGDATGYEDFSRRNRFNNARVPNGHILSKYVQELVPPGKSAFNVPISEDKTAQHVAGKVLPIYAAGQDVQLGMDDGVYESDSASDKELIALQFDKYFMTQSYTDAFMTFYNKVAEILMKAAPESKARIGFLAYTNITLPPVRVKKAAKPLVAYLAPIDFDPIHGFDDPKSGPKRELKEIFNKWVEVMDGRVVIYDYDQGMLVWRDLPNPSHQAFAVDVKHFRDKKILGIDTESRGAWATTFTNIYLRGQLMWNPDADVDALLNEFYTKFYGPTAKPMSEYWGAVFKAWKETIVTEHEYFLAPAIYTPELIETMRKHLDEAEAIIKPIQAKGNLDRNEKLYVDRMKFQRLAFDVVDGYLGMVLAAATEGDYATAAAIGKKTLATREQLTDMNGIFTTYRKMPESTYPWFPGEVQQYSELIPLVDGTKGTLITKLPLEWNFRRDTKDVGVKEGWAKDTKGEWEKLRTDLYAQAQGVVTEDAQSFTGHLWYSTDVELDAQQIAGKVHIKFPGMFNEAWLYVNGEEVAHRPMTGMWWFNDYRFEWDADLTGKLKAGKNSITVRLHNPHHFGGMFRRPFLYRAVE